MQLLKIHSALSLGMAFGLILALAGCKTTPAKETPPTTAATPKKKPGPSIPDQNDNLAFQAFVGRLRKAVANRDIPTVAEMMTADFGYRIDPVGEGSGVFEYWNENNVWPELELILNEKFAPKSNYMVAPREFVFNEAEYTGYRAGIQLVNGSWKFAYFVAR